MPEQISVHLDRSYHSEATRERLKSRSFAPEISEKDKPVLLQIGKRWMVEHTNSRHDAHKKNLM